jgi:hypothetical protein
MRSLKSEAWSGREDLNLRLPAPKATRPIFNIPKSLKIKDTICAGCGYLLWFSLKTTTISSTKNYEAIGFKQMIDHSQKL